MALVFADNPYVGGRDPASQLLENTTRTDAEGRFRLLVCPGPGLIVAQTGELGDAAGIGLEAITERRQPGSRPFATLPFGLTPHSVKSILAIEPPHRAVPVEGSLRVGCAGSGFARRLTSGRVSLKSAMPMGLHFP